MSDSLEQAARRQEVAYELAKQEAYRERRAAYRRSVGDFRPRLGRGTETDESEKPA